MLPKEDVINEVKRRIDNEEFITNCNKEALKILSELSFQFMTFRIDDYYYKQNDGLFIGSPASPAFAEIYIQRLEEISIYNMVHAPKLWLRKVDDTFTITKHEVEDTLEELNAIHPQIKFTAEKYENGMLPFLDCCVLKDNNVIKTKVFRKSTHTGQYNNFKSNQPLTVKLATIKTLVRRAMVICTEERDLQNELHYIQKTMELNDFPHNLVKKTIEEMLEPKGNNKTENDQEFNINKIYKE